MRFSRAASALLLAVVGVIGVATAAVARTGNGPFELSDENVTYSGSVTWNPNRQQVGWGHGGMVVSGYLTDANCNGHWVYVSAKVVGYGYTVLKENRNGCGSTNTDAATEVYDPAATYISDGVVKACQDDAFADTCTAESMYR